MKKGFSPGEVAELLGVCRSTIYREMWRGKLAAAKVGSRTVITEADLRRYIGEDRARVLMEAAQ